MKGYLKSIVLISLALMLSVTVGCGLKTEPMPKQDGKSTLPAIEESRLLYFEGGLLFQAKLPKTAYKANATHLVWGLKEIQKQGCILCGRSNVAVTLELATGKIKITGGLQSSESAMPLLYQEDKPQGMLISIYLEEKSINPVLQLEKTQHLGVAHYVTKAGVASSITESIFLVNPKDVTPPKVQKVQVVRDAAGKEKGQGKEILLSWKPKKLIQGQTIDEDGNLQDYVTTEILTLIQTKGETPSFATLPMAATLQSGFYRLPVKDGRWTIHRKDSFGNISKGEVVYESTP